VGQTITYSNLIDLAPTLLHLKGLAVPQDMDGQIITEMLEGDAILEFDASNISESCSQAKLTPEKAWTVEDEQEMLERLRNLGYL
jgi:arylsulfatase A-like enzyme